VGPRSSLCSVCCVPLIRTKSARLLLWAVPNLLTNQVVRTSAHGDGSEGTGSSSGRFLSILKFSLECMHNDLRAECSALRSCCQATAPLSARRLRRDIDGGALILDGYLGASVPVCQRLHGGASLPEGRSTGPLCHNFQWGSSVLQTDSGGLGARKLLGGPLYRRITRALCG
jgi:hypothetical protein